MASSCLNWLESIEEWSKKWDKTSHQKSNKSDIDDWTDDGSHTKLWGERDIYIIRLRNATEDERAFRQMLTSADPDALARVATQNKMQLSMRALEIIKTTSLLQITLTKNTLKVKYYYYNNNIS